jgi:hypothetical protein
MRWHDVLGAWHRPGVHQAVGGHRKEAPGIANFHHDEGIILVGLETENVFLARLFVTDVEHIDLGRKRVTERGRSFLFFYLLQHHP